MVYLPLYQHIDNVYDMSTGRVLPVWVGAFNGESMSQKNMYKMLGVKKIMTLYIADLNFVPVRTIG